MTAEPVFNLLGSCDFIGVEVLARALIAFVPSREWLPLAKSHAGRVCQAVPSACQDHDGQVSAVEPRSRGASLIWSVHGR